MIARDKIRLIGLLRRGLADAGPLYLGLAPRIEVLGGVRDSQSGAALNGGAARTGGAVSIGAAPTRPFYRRAGADLWEGDRLGASGSRERRL